MRFAVGVVLLVLCVPASARAQNATVSVGGSPGEVTYAGSTGVDNFFVSVGNPVSWIFQRNNVAAALMTAGPGCTDVFADGTRLTCSITGGATINLNAGDDFVGGGADGHGMTFNGGAGNDTIVPSGNAVHNVNGDAGNDFVNGSASLNQDNVDGGPDNDSMLNPRGPDDVHGGAGVDDVEFATGGVAVSVTLDDVTNDGRVDDFDSNIHSDVENLTGGDEADAFSGSAQANVLASGGGNDTLEGGGGQDTLNAGQGDDTVEARDGQADSIDCGLGADTATVDPLDTTAGCETVNLPDDDGDGVKAPQDCNDNDFSIHPGAVDTPGDGIDQDCSGADAPLPPPPPPADKDGDGSLPPADCDDANAAIRPGAVDVPGDGVDQDCSGADAAFLRMTSTVQNRWLVRLRSTRVVLLRVRGAPAGTRVRVTCKGKGCAFRRKTLSTAAGKVGLTRLFPRALRPGAVIELRITAPGFTPKTVRYTIRRGKIPAVRIL